MIKIVAISVAVLWYSAASAQTSAPSPANALEPPNPVVAPAPGVVFAEDMWVHRGGRRGWVMEREFPSASECQTFAKQYAAENNIPVGCAPHGAAPVRPDEKKLKP